MRGRGDTEEREPAVLKEGLGVQISADEIKRKSAPEKAEMTLLQVKKQRQKKKKARDKTQTLLWAAGRWRESESIRKAF